MEKNRCNWKFSSKKMLIYHDIRWCKPLHNDNELFAMLILEGAQAGLSWSTILNREENYRKAFDNFDPEIVAKYDDNYILELMNNKGIIRNKLKIISAIKNAQNFLKIKEKFESFDKYIWNFTDGKIIDKKYKNLKDIPAKSDLSEKISKDLKARGFSFVGPTIIYSYLQGIGIYNDHIETCDYR